MNDQCYSIKTVAELLEIKPDTVRRMIDNGRLRCIKLGPSLRSRIRIPAAWLRADLGISGPSPNPPTPTRKQVESEQKRAEEAIRNARQRRRVEY